VNSCENEILNSAECPEVFLRVLRERNAKQPDITMISPDSPDCVRVSLPPSLLEYLLFYFDDENRQCDFSSVDFLADVYDFSDVTFMDNPNLAEDRLKNIADIFLCHDLSTRNTVVPSRVVVRERTAYLLRRSRGYVPFAIHLMKAGRKGIAAFGSDRSACVSIGLGRQIIPSEYLGILRGISDADILQKTLERLFVLFDFIPDVIACDSRKSSFSLQIARKYALDRNLPIVPVDSLHAQTLASMTGKGIKKSLVLYLSDGLMMTDCDRVGAELLNVSEDKYEILASFLPVSHISKTEYIQRNDMLLWERINSFSAEEPEKKHIPEKISDEIKYQYNEIIHDSSAGSLLRAVSYQLGLTD